MAWLAVDKDESETIFVNKPHRDNDIWGISHFLDSYVILPKGTIEKIIGRVLTWDDEPVEIK